MASAWGSSWGLAWGNSWGIISTEAVSGGGAGKTKKKVRGWANERAALEASLWVKEENTVKPSKKKRKKELDYKIEGIEELKKESDALKLFLLEREARIEARKQSRNDFETYLKEDEEDAITSILLNLSIEERLTCLP